MDINEDDLKLMNDEEIMDLLDEFDYEEDGESDNELDSELDSESDNELDDMDFKQDSGADNKNKNNNIIFCEECNTADYIIDDNIQGISVCRNCGNVFGYCENKWKHNNQLYTCAKK